MKKLLLLKYSLMAIIGVLGMTTVAFSVFQFRNPERYGSPLFLLVCICAGLIAYLFIEGKIKIHRKYHDDNK
ncbi:hypothetical protein [Halobacillus sp. B23F22_1]|uniref:hypothetical protein n=1 Tax=Halobacillus sp. B23F22_1 TaxID=3459514 RepID=UPI00373E95CD